MTNGSTERVSKQSPTCDVSLSQAIEVAALLHSEDGENPEYDRALYELIGDLWGVPDVPLEVRKNQIRSMILQRMVKIPENQPVITARPPDQPMIEHNAYAFHAGRIK